MSFTTETAHKEVDRKDGPNRQCTIIRRTFQKSLVFLRHVSLGEVAQILSFSSFPNCIHPPRSRRISTQTQTHIPPSSHPHITDMGCAPSKLSNIRSGKSVDPVPRYTGPKEFRGSVMPERKPNRHAAQMHQPSRKLERQWGIGEGRRYSWEGHSSEKVFTTFDQLAERGIIPDHALRKKS